MNKTEVYQYEFFDAIHMLDDAQTYKYIHDRTKKKYSIY